MRLDQFLKLRGLVGSGGQAKRLIQEGWVLVNDQPETRRRRKLMEGDVIRLDGNSYRFEETSDEP